MTRTANGTGRVPPEIIRLCEKIEADCHAGGGRGEPLNHGARRLPPAVPVLRGRQPTTCTTRRRRAASGSLGPTPTTLLTDDPEKAWKVMAWTANHQSMLKASGGTKAVGRKLEKPVFAFSVSWHPEQKPDKAHMLATAQAAAAVLGLEGHQAIYVCHNDEPQPHVHVLVNRVHPETGKAATLSRSKAKLVAVGTGVREDAWQGVLQGAG